MVHEASVRCLSRSRRCRSRIGRLKVVRRDHLACQHTLVDQILNISTIIGAPLSSFQGDRQTKKPLIKELPRDGDLLVVRRVLNMQEKGKDEAQREDIFHIRKYKDEVLYGVIPMEARHILLGHPWKFDHKVTHNGSTNRFSFIYIE
ncbi:hypothetical protein CR513_50766, partial [Mucuna pruriens]